MGFKYKVGFIGLGNMASAIIHGILAADKIPAKDISAFDISDDKRRFFAEKGLSVQDNASSVIANSKYVFLCVKPQVIGDVLAPLGEYVSKDNVFVSIVAGVSASFIKKALGNDVKIVLVMPNTPLMLGVGASALAPIAPTNNEEFKFVKEIFASSGISEEIPGDKLNEVIPVNGSSPAFIYLFAKIVADYAQEKGIDHSVALRLFSQTLIGSAKMLTDSGMSPDELIKMVSSPGGTTLKALDALDRCGFKNAVETAMDDCIMRAYELGK